MSRRGCIALISGSGGAPKRWFVSSGHTSANSKTFLLTGTTSTRGHKEDYSDVHGVSCFLGPCSVAFTGTNIRMCDVLSGQNRAGDDHQDLRGKQGMGLISINLPGRPLVDAIIAATSADASRPAGASRVARHGAAETAGPDPSDCPCLFPEEAGQTGSKRPRLD